MELADLKKIGLTEGEIKIYDALLDLGESTRTELAKKSGVSPSKIYDVANRLLEKGIISSVKKNGVIHFSAADPEKLKDFLQHKEAEIKKEKELVDQLLPTLLAKYQQTEEETDIEVLYGWEGMKTAFDAKVKVLDPGEFDYVFGASRGYNSKQADIFFSQYYQKKQKKGFGTKIIFNEDVKENEERTAIFRKKPNEMRFLLQDTFTEINFYQNTVLLILLLKKPIVIKVKNKDAVDSFKKFFETMWKMAAN
ncbi:MAG: helix-turn-helix domain-containing protein [Nanoarchaeota archaeon]|nr:helix-turn-helix domain-containing protein [Nanoarchaeota archaeon]MBU1643999.1 helix-turn-helix domain-containing protein [Nanoarchaeota archaeon]MBU1977094.1 helix-turn-helix domain-containing protein [Nanoarchaeota archaeon]